MKYGVIGEKLGHSFSASIHHGLGGYEYEVHAIAPEKLDEFMRQHLFLGINVTIPYKEKVIPYCAFVDPLAKEIGAVNTVINKNGLLFGYNTDFNGFSYLLQTHGVKVQEKNVLILGTGGTSKTAAAVLRSMGAKSIVKVSRFEGENTITYAQAVTKKDTQIIVNTTPMGMYPKGQDSPIDLSEFTALEAVVDVVYNPIRTKLVAKAQLMGIKAVGGLEMLVAQALYASEKFMDRSLGLENVQNIFLEMLYEKTNIVLIGMPACGKSSVGKAVAKLCNKRFVDVDEEIVKEMGMSIPQMFELMGEEGFREVEKKVTARISQENGLVVATGGGVVLHEDNITALMGNGVLIYLNRPKELLDPGDGRPLFQNVEALGQLLKDRIPLYEKYGEGTVLNDTSHSEAAKRVKEKYDEILCNQRTESEYVGDQRTGDLRGNVL